MLLSSNLLLATNLENGDKIVSQNCQGCHKLGLLNSPKIGDKTEWNKRVKQGYSVLVQHAVNGFNSMPAKGGLMTMTLADVEDAVASLLNSASISVDSLKTPKADNTEIAIVTKAMPEIVPEIKKSKKIEPIIQEKMEDTSAALPKQIAASKKVNRFNRLMQPKSDWNQPPAKDGIHDADNEGTYLLQTPKEAFAELSKTTSGNHVNWVKALEDGNILPRFDLSDPDKQPFVMDLDIVREVKGSMPDVVYPHKAHTQWLDCSNCHPAIFIPKKGANQISMASILMGKQCGVCHGKVAFPVSECRLCHSKKKARKTIKTND